MNKPKISLIVPIYNTIEYLEKCLDSIINQSFKEFEIILVDDGSTDGSELKCDEHARRDRRIKVVHQKNAGLVNARKTGLREAAGDYIYYVDSDDWIDRNIIESFMDILSQHPVDMISIGIKREYENSECINEKLPFREGVYDKEQIQYEMIPQLIRTDNFFDWGQCLAYWHFLIKKELLIKNQQVIADSISILEDVACVYPCILDSKKIYVKSSVFYHYRQRSKSMKCSRGLKEYQNLQIVYKILMTRFDKEIEAKVLEKKAKYLLLFMLLIMDMDKLDIKGEMFPFKDFPKGSKVVIYGAGIFGSETIAMIEEKKHSTVVAWVDKNYDIYQKRNMKVDSPDRLFTIDYDYVILAVIRADIREEIRKELLARKVSSNKIIDFDINKIDGVSLPEEFTYDNLPKSVIDSIKEVEDESDHISSWKRE